VQFSRFLELFFGTYLNKEIWKKFKNVYTVFSGWDDFVFIVPFSQREEFITYLNESFEKWVALNPNLHFSVWLWLFKDKTPFHQMDRKTESLLNSAKLKTKELNRMEISLKNKWICIFEPDFMVLWNQIDFKFWIKKWKDWSEFVIWDTQIHNTYSELRKIQEVLEWWWKDYAKLVLIWARIINMLGRNKKEVKEKQEFQDLQQDIRDFIQKVDLNEQSKKEKQDKINKVLLGIVDEIYEKRYRSNC
jgi:CRISPR/Cas system-associated protein Cas10 (large subunit of type III CRISPR-Cas system)